MHEIKSTLNALHKTNTQCIHKIYKYKIEYINETVNIEEEKKQKQKKVGIIMILLGYDDWAQITAIKINSSISSRKYYSDSQ